MPGRKATAEERREQIVGAAYDVALRQGINGLTLRAVADQAKLSHGLVVFYFKQKEQLIAALLERVLATTTMLNGAEDTDRHSFASDGFGGLLTRELDRLSRDSRGMRLFFEYWALGVRHAAIRRRIRVALEQYRGAFRMKAEEMLPAEARHDGVTPDALAAVAVSLINGCAVQAMIDPAHFDTNAYLAAVHGLIERVAPLPA